MNTLKNNNHNHQAIRKPIYIGINIENDGLYIAIKDKNKVSVKHIKTERKELDKKISAWLYTYQLLHDVKIIGAGIVGHEERERKLMTNIWLKEDIVPVIFYLKEGDARERARKAVVKLSQEFKENNLIDVRFNSKRKILVKGLAGLEDFKKTVSKEEFNLLQELTEKFKEQKGKLVFFSSTSQGGGVALMRHALIRFYELLGIDVSWHVMSPDEQIFNITKKKFHNTLQNSTSEDKLSTEDKKIFNTWSEKNAKSFAGIFKKAKVIVIDDPQPSGLIPYIKKENPKVKIIYRSHIQIESALAKRDGTPQKKVWDFIWKNIKDVDLFISHPIKRFIPPNVPKKKTVFMGAATDYLDGLNKKLTKQHMEYYFSLFNNILYETDQSPLNLRRPYIIQVARFDPSKGIPDVLESYKKLREKMEKDEKESHKVPQLVIVGHGAIDDPEGMPIYQETIDSLETDDYKKYADDIKVARLPDSDQILNALLRGSFVALQLSHKEGFEVKVSEAISKGKPVIAYKTGGIPLQIEDKITGYLVNDGDTSKVAEIVYKLLNDKEKYFTMRKNAKQKVEHDFFTVNNAIKWLFLATELMEKGEIDGNCQRVKEIIKKQKSISLHRNMFMWISGALTGTLNLTLITSKNLIKLPNKLLDKE